MTTDTVLETKKTTRIKEPRKFKVVVYNDDVTPMEFVIIMFRSVFKATTEHAIALTMEIHNNGSAVAGVYNYEIAEQKAIDATELARANSFPLVLRVEQE